MPRFDRYLLVQLLTLFGFFALVLVLIYWINRAVALFDQIIADGQSAWVFLELTAYALPSIIKIVIPLATFAAGVYVANRMASESELVVSKAAGISPFRIMRPVVTFGVLIAVLMLVLNHFLVPLSQSRLIERQNEISRNLTARLLTEGKFLSPSSGVTIYIRDITPEGELRDVFLSDSRRAERQISYTASRAFLVRSETGPQLVMIDGLAQVYREEDQRLFTTAFDDFAYDVSALVPDIGPRNRSYAELSTAELLSPTQAITEETGRSADFLIYAGHDRFAQALLALVGACLGFATLLVGQFSRFGMWKHILSAIFLVVLVKILESAGASLARGNAALWPLTYLSIIGGTGIVLALLFSADYPYFFKRKPRVILPATEGVAP